MRRFRFLALALTLVTAIGASSALPGQISADGTFTFQEGSIEGFELEAKTDWTASGAPSIKDISCVGDNQDIRFEINQFGAIDLLSNQFLIQPDAQGCRNFGTSLDDELWFYIDGKRFEFRFISSPSDKFSNFPYAGEGNSGDIILAWHGTRSVRPNGAEEFRPIAGYYEQIVTARRLEWAIKAFAPDQHRERMAIIGKRYRINNTGLSLAVAWCRQAVFSPQARRLPAELLNRFVPVN